MQNVDHNIGTDDTVRLLVRTDRSLGFVDHIPDVSGLPLCKTRLKVSLWQIEERPVTVARVCHRCQEMEAKLGHS